MASGCLLNRRNVFFWTNQYFTNLCKWVMIERKGKNFPVHIPENTKCTEHFVKAPTNVKM